MNNDYKMNPLTFRHNFDNAMKTEPAAAILITMDAKGQVAMLFDGTPMQLLTCASITQNSMIQHYHGLLAHMRAPTPRPTMTPESQTDTTNVVILKPESPDVPN